MAWFRKKKAPIEAKPAEEAWKDTGERCIQLTEHEAMVAFSALQVLVSIATPDIEVRFTTAYNMLVTRLAENMLKEGDTL